MNYLELLDEKIANLKDITNDDCGADVIRQLFEMAITTDEFINLLPDERQLLYIASNGIIDFLKDVSE